MRTFGVEEEFLLVDSVTGRCLPLSGGLLDHHSGRSLDRGQETADLAAELQQEMIEVITRPQEDLGELAAAIRHGRAVADESARALGARVVALATAPLPAGPHTVERPRYRQMTMDYGLTAREQLTCGCHVHVAIDSDEEGVAVLDRLRIWLPVLVALGANSPFWQGTDTGYASYRSQVWSRWPSAGPTEILGSARAYHRLVEEMISTGVVLDEGMVYFDARLSRHHPTVEIRTADVCLNPDDTALLAALVRALVETSAREWRAGIAPHPVPSAVLRLAAWKAGRWGLDGELLYPPGNRPDGARRVIGALLDHVRPALREAGDERQVERLLAEVLRRGTGATRQRAVHQQRGNLTDVVADAVDLTHAAMSDTWA